MRFQKYFSFCLFFISTLSYSQNNSICSDTDYSFFVAGHVYGDPNSDHDTIGLYQPFLNKIDEINSCENLEIGMLTGDVVIRPDSIRFSALERDLSLLNIPYQIAPGNHDKGSLFFDNYDYNNYFYLHKDLFININLSKWNITDANLSMIDSIYNANNENINNIFIFMHELSWWSPDSIFKDISINYPPHYPGETNFWSTIAPLMKNYNKEVYFFTGDLGANYQASPCTYHNSDNLHLIGTGMGNGINDNILIVDIINQKPTIRLISLTEETSINNLGEFYSYCTLPHLLVNKEQNHITEFVRTYGNTINSQQLLKLSQTLLIDKIILYDLKGKIISESNRYYEQDINQNLSKPFIGVINITTVEGSQLKLKFTFL